ncbi:MAG: hypothetical protein V2I43_21475 [Parvularcula sp.]|nr:hypothetical protein [Parvularcula sp.]
MTVLSNKTVLILEDEPLIALVAEEYVKRLGAGRVVRVSSVDKAAAILRDEPIDAALFDSNSEGQASFSLAHQSWALGKATVVAGNQTEGGDDTFSATAKPYSLEHLEQAFQSAFSRLPGHRVV